MIKFFVCFLFAVTALGAPEDFLCGDKLRVFKDNFAPVVSIPEGVKGRFAKLESLNFELFHTLETVESNEEMEKYLSKFRKKYASFHQEIAGSIKLSKELEGNLSYAVRYFKEDFKAHVDSSSLECMETLKVEIFPLYRKSIDVLVNLSNRSLQDTLEATEVYISQKRSGREVSDEIIDTILLRYMDN